MSQLSVCKGVSAKHEATFDGHESSSVNAFDVSFLYISSPHDSTSTTPRKASTTQMHQHYLEH
jgi:hypothetical protein